MNYQKEIGRFESSNELSIVQYFVYTPTKPIKAMVQLVHGMAEHVERYEPYIDYLTGEGFLVFGDNHLGHKGSVDSDSELGFFSNSNGWKYLIEDEVILSGIMKKRYPELPLFLYGHSMGSFISRAYATEHPELISGAIFSGSSGSNPALNMGKIVTGFVKGSKGHRYYSKFLDKLMFGKYNSKIAAPRTPFDWLSRDEDVVDAYIQDPYCGFLFTVSGYLDLENLLQAVTKDEWYTNLPSQLPVLFISGSEDPVGGWGAGLAEINERMLRMPRKDYEMKIFDGMRHEIHNEIGKEEAWAYVANWLNERV